ncbi:hypothetical protein THAOC_10296, partial [Thalassiosira oceanica]
MAAALVLLCRSAVGYPVGLQAPSLGRSRRLHSTLLFADAIFPESFRSPRDQQTRAQKRKSSQTLRRSAELERPEIIYSSNHVCVVNKPPGWKSQPGNGAGGGEQRMEDEKCLLSYLKSQSEGGGSKKDFIVPTHRLDQPCTGVLVFAKNGKAASRIQVAWSKQQVRKEYWVVVETGDDLNLLKKRSEPLHDKRTFRLSAILKVNKSAQKGGRRGNKNAGGSVVVKPLSSGHG